MGRILLIEHDPDFATLLRKIFEDEGYDVDWAESVDHAISRVTTFNPTVTVVDMHDGDLVTCEDIRILREHDREFTILVTTDYKTPELACKALNVGASDFLLKPFGTREILERIQSLAGSGNGNGTASEIDTITDSIRFLSSVDDVLQVALDQISTSLHLRDCFIALRESDGYRVMVSKGYTPDPSSRLIDIPIDRIEGLFVQGSEEALAASGTISEIKDMLGIRGHRPFPTILPLKSQSDEGEQIMGFIMGDGAIVLDEKDILEMERFLHQVVDELTEGGKRKPETEKPMAEHSGEYSIPEVHRDDATDAIISKISTFLPDEKDQVWIRLVLDEAISNAIMHGHKEPLDHPETPLTIRYEIGRRRLLFTVTDQGPGFDPRRVPDPTADENLMSINGRGIYIIRNVMDEIVYNDKGNKVTMIKVLDGKPLGPDD